MTKEQFLSGAQFYIGVKTYKGTCTYSLSQDASCIMKQSRSSVDDRIVLEDYECNVTKLGRLSFTGFTYVMKKKVNVSYKFEDLVEFEEGA